jgi:hypothetical protein
VDAMVAGDLDLGDMDEFDFSYLLQVREESPQRGSSLRRGGWPAEREQQAAGARPGGEGSTSGWPSGRAGRMTVWRASDGDGAQCRC